MDQATYNKTGSILWFPLEATQVSFTRCARGKKSGAIAARFKKRRLLDEGLKGSTS